jgi:uncharacterized UPF0160 family protein
MNKTTDTTNLSNNSQKIKLATHNSGFHADDVFATACLKIYFEDYKNQETEIVRSRDEEILNDADIVFDVGMIYDPKHNRFDHHQTGGAGTRGEFDIPYSSFGLIWKHFGSELTENSSIHQTIDEKFVQQICAADTGAVDFSIKDLDWNAWTFDSVVKLFYPEKVDDDKQSYEAFIKCVEIAKSILEKIILKYTKKYKDTISVNEIYEKTDDKRILIFDKYYSYTNALEDKSEVIYVIFPDSNKKTYRIKAVTEIDNHLNIKKPFPKPWRGKWRKELQQITGLDKAEFVHNVGFLAAANDLETAIRMAEISLDFSE